MSILLFAQMGAFGPAILLVCCLALMAIIGFFFVTYFAHTFLLVVVETAAGINEVRWPADSIVDMISKPLYVLWVLLPLLFPPFLVLMATGSAVAFGITVLALLWLVSPIMFLSSLAAKSWMSLLYGPLLARWARYPFAYILFLVWAAPVIALGAALFVWSMVSLAGVFVAAIALPVLCLLYARILGRYAWYVTTRQMRKVKKKKQRSPVKGLKVKSLDPWAPPDAEDADAGLSDPSMPHDGDTSLEEAVRAESAAALDKLEPAAKLAPAEAPEEEDEWTTNKRPYGVMTETQARESWVKREASSAGDAEGYEVQDLTFGAPVSLFNYYMEREKKEELLRQQGKSVRQYERPRKAPTLAEAMTREIFAFLFFPHTLRAWINLFLLFGATLGLLNIIVMLTIPIARS